MRLRLQVPGRAAAGGALERLRHCMQARGRRCDMPQVRQLAEPNGDLRASCIGDVTAPKWLVAAQPQQAVLRQVCVCVCSVAP